MDNSLYNTPDQSPGFLLWHISTTWRTSLETMLKTMGLTHPQFVILATLGWLTRNNALVTQREVGKMAGLDPNTVSQIIKGLEKKGLISRQSSSDGRAKNPMLTMEGSQILRKALPAVEKKDHEFFQVLAEEEMEQLLSIFQKILFKISKQ